MRANAVDSASIRLALANTLLRVARASVAEETPPLSAEEEAQGDKIRQALERVRQDYDAQYIREWTEFFRDIDVAIPQNNIEAIEEFRVLSTPDWPYWRLLRALKENTQFYEDEDGAAAAATADGGVLDQINRRVKR